MYGIKVVMISKIEKNEDIKTCFQRDKKTI